MVFFGCDVGISLRFFYDQLGKNDLIILDMCVIVVMQIIVFLIYLLVVCVVVINQVIIFSNFCIDDDVIFSCFGN